MIPHVVRSALITALVTGATVGATVSASSLHLRLTNGPSTISLKGADSVPLNSPGIIEPGMCLTIGLAKEVAYQCGHLRLTYPLQSVRVLGKVQTPTLIYNSEQAVPHPLVTLEIAIPSSTTVPESIAYVVSNTGGILSRQVIPSSLLSPSSSSRKRIQVGWNAASTATGVYPVTILARSYYGSDSSNTASVNTKVIVVNRGNSPFGLGWWLAGVDQLYSPGADTSLWVGGDGSARVFRKVATNVWVADSLDRLDTLTYIPASTTYERRFSGGARVVFNATGQHITTIDPRGFPTTIAYQSSSISAPLSTIKLPKLDTAYRFVYKTNGGNTIIDSVVAPHVTGNGANFFVPFGRAFLQAFDPDSADVHFEFDDDARIIKRWDRSGVVSRYVYDNHSQLSLFVLEMESGSDTTKICPFFSLSSAACGTRLNVVANATVRVDGPRPDTLDFTKFRIGRFGALSWIQNAKGDTTSILRQVGGCNTYPAFVTEVVAPNGLRTTACSDSLGHADTVTVYNALGDGFNQTTKYTWDPKWDKVTRIKDNANNTTFVASYNSTNGNIDSIADGRDTSATRFAYGTSGNEQYLLTHAIRPPARGRPAVDYEYLTYDALGNPTGAYEMTDSNSTSFARGAKHYAQDAIGRTSSTCVDIVVEEHPRSNCHYTTFDRRGRDSVLVEWGDTIYAASPLPLIPAQATTVRKYWGNEGQLIAISREKTGSGAQVYTRYTYDRAGRVTREWQQNPISDAVAADTLKSSYDQAGNLVSTVNRRGAEVTMTYDVMNRLVRRVVPATLDTAARPAGSIGEAQASYPYNNGSGGSYIMPADKDTFTYDAAGRMLTANNDSSRITRTYTPNGMLKTDVMQMAKAQGGFVTYALDNEYDALNRRSQLKLPSALAGGDSTIHFSYVSITNELDVVTDPFGNAWDFDYNKRGELDTLRSPGSVKQMLRYDGVGNVVKDSLRSSSALLRSTSFSYDHRGKRLTANDATVGFAEADTFRYSGLGHLARSHVSQDLANGYGGTGHGGTVESFTYDALGSIETVATVDTVKRAIHGCCANTFTVSSASHSLDSLWRIKSVVAVQAGIANIRTYQYDADGNVIFFLQKPVTDTGGLYREDRYSYYDAAGRLRAADFRIVQSGFPAQSPDIVFEQYRYDALGRRYWVRADKFCAGSHSEMACARSTLRRTIWDGDRELMEIQVPVRTPGYAASSSTVLDNDNYQSSDTLVHGLDHNPYFGRVLYIPGLSIDQPVGFVRYNYSNRLVDSTGAQDNLLAMAHAEMSILWDQKGRPSMVRCTTGAERCTGTRTGNSHVARQVVNIAEQFSMIDRSRFDNFGWQGTIIEDKADDARTNFRRNRYYVRRQGGLRRKTPLGSRGGSTCMGLPAEIRLISAIRLG